MPIQSSTLDHLFRAIADPTRRGVLDRLAKGPSTVLELARPYHMALPSFLQHLDVLEKSGLIRTTKLGRVRTCTLNSARLIEAEGWLIAQRRLWERRLDKLDEHLMNMNKQKPNKRKQNR